MTSNGFGKLFEGISQMTVLESLRLDFPRYVSNEMMCITEDSQQMFEV